MLPIQSSILLKHVIPLQPRWQNDPGKLSAAPDSLRAESEYVAVSSCCAQVLWMRTQLTDYGFFYDKVPIYCDSKSAIAISCNPEAFDKELEAPIEDQPLPTNASPTALLLGYINDSNPEEDEEDPEEDPIDYPTNGGDNDDIESSDDDNDDDNDVEKDGEDDEEETMTTVNQGMSVEEIDKCFVYLHTTVLEHSDTGSKDWCIQVPIDQQRFTLNSNILRDALEITPVDPANPFVSPSAGDIVMDFMNELGYPEAIHFCLTGKTSRNDKPRHPVLQMLWEIVTGTNVDYAKLLWEEFFKESSPSLLIGGVIKFLPRSQLLKEGKPKPKPVKEKSTKPTPLQKVGKGKVMKVRNVKSSLQLVDESKKEQAQPEPEHQGAGEEYDVERAIQMSLELFQAQGQAHVGGVAIREPRQTPATEEASTGPSTQPQDDASTNMVCDSPSPVDAETKVVTDKTNSGGDTEILQIGEEQGEDVADKVNLEEKAAKIDEGQAGSDLDEEQDQPEDVPEPQGAGEEYNLKRVIQMSLESFQAQGQAYVGGVAIREPVAEVTCLLHVVEVKTFFTHRDINKIPSKNPTPHVILYYRFTKLIIYYLGIKYNIHRRPDSPRHVTSDDFLLGNLKFVPKGEIDEVFGIQIPEELITDNIRNAPYYNAYLEMVAKHDLKIAAEKGTKKKSASKADKSKKPETAKQPKPKHVKEKSTKPTPVQKASKGKETKVRKVKSSLQLVYEPKEEQAQPKPEPEHHGVGEEYDRWTLATKEASTRPSTQPQDDASINIVRDSPSPADAETGANTDKTNSGDDTKILQIDWAGSDPGKTLESRPPPERVFIEEDQAGPDPRLSHVALVGPPPEPMHDDFVATIYPQVHESLKHPDEEHTQVENPLSLTRTLSSMKNMNAYTFSDQLFNDKLIEEEPDKANMETKVESMVTVLIHQASSSAHSLSTPVVDLSPLCANFEKRHKLHDNTVQGISSRVFILELKELPHKINQIVNKVVKDAVYVAFQAPLRDRLREVPEADMKEILHQRMFKSGSYKSLSENVALYESLEASIDCANRDEFLAEKDKSQKRCRNDQDPPLPPDSDLIKKRRHDSDALGSKQPPAP
nr:uncharacterized mitochondrial protein AtMg00810-like [Tanacetum cinerariifolium]